MERNWDMAKGDVETYFEDGQWKSKDYAAAARGLLTSAGRRRSKRAVGHEMAQTREVEHVIKKKNGKVKERRRATATTLIRQSG